MILVFGILGLIVCVIFAIVAWVMGNSDLREMAEGRMDRAGEGLTKAGKILGIVSVVLNCIGILIWVLLMILGIGLAAAGAGAAGAGGGGP
jgi:hypothetical protein